MRILTRFTAHSVHGKARRPPNGVPHTNPTNPNEVTSAHSPPLPRAFSTFICYMNPFCMDQKIAVIRWSTLAVDYLGRKQPKEKDESRVPRPIITGGSY